MPSIPSLLAAGAQSLLQASVSSNLRAFKKSPELVASFAIDLVKAEGLSWERLTKAEKLVWMKRVGKTIDLMADALDPGTKVMTDAKKLAQSVIEEAQRREEKG